MHYGTAEARALIRTTIMVMGNLKFSALSRNLSDANVYCPERELVKMYYFLRDNAVCFRLYFVGSLPGAAPGRRAST
jgi:hypothetical protein